MSEFERKRKYAEAFRLLHRAIEILEHVERECEARAISRA